MILDQSVGLQGVRPDLAAPGYGVLVCILRLFFLLVLLQLLLI